MGISLNKTSVLTTFKEYLMMTLGMTLYSFGWICCILPANAAGGGATGLSLLLYHLTGGAISIGTMVLIINAILLVIAGFVVGWNFGIKTIYCVVSMSVVMHFLQVWFTVPDGWVAQLIVARDALSVPSGTIVDLFNLNNRLLSAILGGICSGAGVALCCVDIEPAAACGVHCHGYVSQAVAAFGFGGYDYECGPAEALYHSGRSAGIADCL